jgi:3-hydroxybutyryl-CoA dehydrogenase
MATPSLHSISSVGVIGAGQMGSGIAHVCALAGYDVKVADIDEKVLQKAIATIDSNMARQVARGRVSEDDKAAA